MQPSAPILQYIVYGKRTWGTRVFTNGQVDEYSDQAVEVTPDGDFKTHLVPLDWRSRAHLTPPQVEHLKTAIANSDFFDLPTSQPLRGRVRDGATTVWTIHFNQVCHEVNVQGTEQANQATLVLLQNTLEDLVADSLSSDESPVNKSLDSSL